MHYLFEFFKKHFEIKVKLGELCLGSLNWQGFEIFCQEKTMTFVAIFMFVTAHSSQVTKHKI